MFNAGILAPSFKTFAPVLTSIDQCSGVAVLAGTAIGNALDGQTFLILEMETGTGSGVYTAYATVSLTVTPFTFSAGAYTFNRRFRAKARRNGLDSAYSNLILASDALVSSVQAPSGLVILAGPVRLQANINNAGFPGGIVNYRVTDNLGGFTAGTVPVNTTQTFALTTGATGASIFLTGKCINSTTSSI